MAHLSPAKFLAKIFTQNNKLTSLDAQICTEMLYQGPDVEQQLSFLPLTSLF